MLKGLITNTIFKSVQWRKKVLQALLDMINLDLTNIFFSSVSIRFHAKVGKHQSQSMLTTWKNKNKHCYIIFIKESRYYIFLPTYFTFIPSKENS